MKVIFVNRYFYPDHSATSQMLTDLAFYLEARGWEIEVIASRQRYDDPNAKLASLERINNLVIRRVATTRFGRRNLAGRLVDFASFYVSAAIRLLLDAKQGDVLVAKTDPPMISAIAAAIGKLKSARLVNWIQDLFPEVAEVLGVAGMSGWRLSVLRVARDWSLRSAAQNVVIGERMRERVSGIVDKPGAVQVVHNWADGDNIAPVARESNALVHEWGLDGKFVVGYSGNMGRAHQFDTILGIVQALKERTDIAFLFIGGGAQRAWVEQQVADQELKNVVFKDYQPRTLLSNSLSVPDLHLISLNPDLEGLIVPSKFYGIAAAGRPMLFIGDRCGEIGRMIGESGCGISTSPGDVAAATGYIEKLCERPEEARSGGRNARKLFVERFSAEHALPAWERVLSGVSGSQNHPAPPRV